MMFNIKYYQIKVPKFKFKYIKYILHFIILVFFVCNTNKLTNIYLIVFLDFYLKSKFIFNYYKTYDYNH